MAATTAAIHELKCWPIYFKALLDGSKTFEVRRNDRNFAVGDLLALREWVGNYTGRQITARVTYVMAGYTDRDGKQARPLLDGYIILGIRKEL